MNTLNELITILTNFNPDQLEKFLTHEVTQSILQAEAKAEPCPLEAPLCG